MGWNMADELATCVAAFFRSIGKEVTTTEEFVMVASLELKWMSPSDAKVLLSMLTSSGIVTVKDGYVRPNGDVSAIDVPLAYRPSADVLARVKAGKGQSGQIPVQKPVRQKPAEKDMFHVLRDAAVANGIGGGDFVKRSNAIQKRLNIDIRVAALIVLRDDGIDIKGFTEGVREAVKAS